MKFSNLKIAIGVPCSFPTVPISFFNSFVLMEKPSFEYICADNGPIDTLRNDIVEIALKAGCTHLLMMDVDQVYHPQTVTRLLSHNLPIVGAAVNRRYPPFDPIILRLTEKGYESIDDYEDGALVECDATGSGCLLFDMRIFKELPYPWFRFQKDPASGGVIGEDIGLCQDLKARGYRIFVDTSVPAGHLTTMIVNQKTHLLYKSMKQAEHKRNAEKALVGK